MKLINQNDYEDVIYVTQTSKPDCESGLHTTIKSSGCGLCTGMMVAEFFNKPLTIDEAIKLSYDYKANTSSGTKYKEYSNALKDHLDLDISRTDNKEDLFKCLDEGGCAVCNVGGDHDDHLGIFSNTGHYIFIHSHNNDELCIYDPGLTKEKYDLPYRKDKVKVAGDCIYSDINVLLDDMTNRESCIFLYRKRKDISSYKDLFKKIDELFSSFVDIWKDVVLIDSPTSYKEGVDKVGKYFIDKAAKNMWNIEVQENEYAGNAICITMNSESNNKPIVISGHMDTVHPINSLDTYIKDGMIFGPGVTDCKGGLVACLLAMKALKECGYKDRPVKFILQSDEEVGSKLSNKKTIEFMIEKSKDALCFINAEMYMDGTVVTTRKGIARYNMIIHGKSVHASLCDGGASAILEASHKIIELEKIKQPDAITINVGTIKGGTTSNTVPDECSFEIDVRFANDDQYKKTKEYITNIANTTYIEGTSTELIETGTRIAMDHKDYNDDLVNKINAIYKNCGLVELKQRKASGGSDAAYTSDAGIPTIDSIGVNGGCIHSKKEYAYLNSLKDSAKRIAAIIYKLS